jgi:uncharacterized membrane protein YgdD (TMEM256/DUF423 family)
MSAPAHRLIVFLGGLAGAAGVGLSAAAAHAGGVNLGTAASFLLAHAPALLVVGLLGGRMAAAGAYGLAGGLLLFCGDLVLRDLAGHRLFPFAAPAGGTLLIAAWLVVAGSAFGPAGRGPCR